MTLIRVSKTGKYDLNRVPTPPGLPIPGHRHTLEFASNPNRDPTKIRGKWWKALGEPKLLRLEVGGRDIIYIYDQECSKQLLSAPDLFPKARHPSLKAIFGANYAQSFFVQPGIDPYVGAVRKAYQRTFQSRGLKRVGVCVEQCIDNMIEVINARRQNGPIDLQDLCIRLTLDVAGRVFFDTNFGGLDRTTKLYEFLAGSCRYSKEMVYRSWNVKLGELFPNLESAKKRRDTLEGLDNIYRELAEDILARDDPQEGEEPFWHLLRNVIDPDTGEALSSDRLRVEVAAVVFSGTDTTGAQVSWLLAAIASHPEVERKILEELEEQGLLSREVAIEDLNKLTYLNATIKEGMRVVYIIDSTPIRTSAEDVEIMGYKFPKGTVFRSAGTRNGSPTAEYGDPDVFRPERWLSGENMTDKLFLGFSHGPRECPGQRLATIEMQMGLIKIFKKFNVKMKVPFQELLDSAAYGMVVEAGDGMWADVSLRSL